MTLKPGDVFWWQNTRGCVGSFSSCWGRCWGWQRGFSPLCCWIKAVPGRRVWISLSPGRVCHAVCTLLEVWHMSLHSCHRVFHARLDVNSWKKKPTKNLCKHTRHVRFIPGMEKMSRLWNPKKSLFRRWTHLAYSVLEGHFGVVLGICFN